MEKAYVLGEEMWVEGRWRPESRYLEWFSKQTACKTLEKAGMLEMVCKRNVYKN